MGLLIGMGSIKPATQNDNYYGIEWDTTVSNPIPTRIGKMELHQSLPVQSKMRRCLLLDDGTVNYYLDENDSSKREDGSPADLTGKDGQFMVELPEMYVKFETEGTKCRALISDKPISGFTKWRKDYVSVDEACIHRPTNTLCAVVNNSPDYRGGNNDASNDDWFEGLSLLQRPASGFTFFEYRENARKRGSDAWNGFLYQIYRKLWWLFAIEYCNFDMQAPFNAKLTPEGFHQGGLGQGVTNLESYAWQSYNRYCPFVPCGMTLALGNHSGVTNYTTIAGAAGFVEIPTYRGVTNIFGHTLKFLDGCFANIMSSEEVDAKSEFWVCDNPSEFAESITKAYELRGEMPRDEGFIKSVILGEQGEVMPHEIGASSSTYFCAQCTLWVDFYTQPTVVVAGGESWSGEKASLLYVDFYEPTTAANKICTRLCYHPLN